MHCKACGVEYGLNHQDECWYCAEWRVKYGNKNVFAYKSADVENEEETEEVKEL